MSDDRSRPIGELARRGARLRIKCACGRESEFDPAELPLRYALKRLSAVAFRCRACSRRQPASIEVVYPDLRQEAHRTLRRVKTGVRDYYADGTYLSCRCHHCHRTADVVFTVGEIERQLNKVNPTVREAAARLKCPSCYRPVFVSVAQEPRREVRPRDRWAGKILD
ncbi:hypothetical protein FHP25_25090 [Vineibacter terrae]|uniref:Uncharacterized protein n=1 Tax=Vineibacter terrae TaxID=2586908 RepID=A0A5C8PFX9_9HYPH|nr:hypothetical protein [Vineibacter terrae]TXL72575.1 hypothetical protein FHP25_25090 [Vineibacter terrae]